MEEVVRFSQIEERQAVLGISLDFFLEKIDRFFVFVFSFRFSFKRGVSHSQAQMCFRVIWIELHGLLEHLGGAFVFVVLVKLFGLID